MRIVSLYGVNFRSSVVAPRFSNKFIVYFHYEAKKNQTFLFYLLKSDQLNNTTKAITDHRGFINRLFIIPRVEGNLSFGIIQRGFISLLYVARVNLERLDNVSLGRTKNKLSVIESMNEHTWKG